MSILLNSYLDVVSSSSMALSAGAAEYTDCISAEE